MAITDFQALDRLYPLPPSDLPRQWLLTRDEGAIPDGWERRSREGWHLGYHSNAHVCDLTAANGAPLGWILEPLVQLREEGGRVPDNRVILPTGPTPGDAELERALYGRNRRGSSDGSGVEGMWAAILLGASPGAPLRRVHLGAIHSVVYAPERRMVAPTHNLIPGLRRDEDLSRAFDPLATHSYYTFGLTAHQGLRRLLPDHYLDLETFQPVRHWPRGALPSRSTGQESAEAVVRHGRRILHALKGSYRRYRLHLSAGHDSRAVLALLEPLVQRGEIDVELSTTVGPDLPSRIDLQAARRLAAIAGLPHRSKTREPHRSDTEQVMRAFVRIGESKAGPILSAPGLRNPRPRDGRFVLAGMAGEAGRGYFWGGGVPPEEVTPEILVRRTKSPVVPPVMKAADRWLQSLPSPVRARPGDVLDLAYVEQRLGCWESSTRYLFPGRPRVLSPMAATLALEAMLGAPASYRAGGDLQRDMVTFGWRELLEVPFNRATGLLRFRSLAGGLRGRWRRILAKLVP